MSATVAEHRCADAPALARALAHDLAGRLRAALQARGTALLAVSGGKSPVALFEQLRQQPLDWARVTVLLVDERCVPPGHADSNAALVRRHLLQGPAAAARFVPFFESVPQPLDDAALDKLVAEGQRVLAGLPWPLDVLVLGLGEDGHTASLFPGAPGLDRALTSAGPLAWVRPATAPHARLTLTLPVLQAARHVALSLTGEAKQAVYRQALRAPDAALPVSLLLATAVTRPLHAWIA